MCGICVVIKLVECKFTAENKERCENECGAAEESETDLWTGLLSNRGPDLQSAHHLVIDAKNNVKLSASFYGHVLHLRGLPTMQPLTDEKGNVLLWNGEIFGGNIQVGDSQNDGTELLKVLSNVDVDCTDEDIVKIFRGIHGPWAFVYWQNAKQQLWFGRDFFGRRSLLWHLPNVSSEPFVLTSVTQNTNTMQFTEVPAKMVHSVSVSKLAAMWLTENRTAADNGEHFESCIASFLLQLPEPDFRANISRLRKFGHLSINEGKISDNGNHEERDLLFPRDPHCNDCIVKGNGSSNLKENKYSACSSEIDLVDGSSVDFSQFEPLQEGNHENSRHPGNETKHLKDIPIYCANFAENLDDLQANESVRMIRNVAYGHLYSEEPPASSTDIYKNFLYYYTHCFMSLLESSTHRRVFNLPRMEIVNPNGKKLQQCSTYSVAIESTLSSPAKVGVLFSGGIDSMVLAAMADRCIPSDEPIDLLNVAFEQHRHQPSKTQSKHRQRNTEIGPKKDPYEVPDRISGQSGVLELNPKRKWNFIEINITLDEVKAARLDRVRHLVYPLQTVLDDSLGCAIWFAASGKGTKYEVQDGTLVKTDQSYTCNAKVLLAGMGADEQLGGYARHRSKFEKFGWKGLEEEMAMEIGRISSRNLGRDDRCISDHGCEARFPFLDENIVNFLQNVPTWIKCDPRLPRGYGEKRLLREVAIRLGLHSSSTLPKRAIQFGSKIAKMENSKEKGSDSCRRLDTNKE